MWDKSKRSLCFVNGCNASHETMLVTFGWDSTFGRGISFKQVIKMKESWKMSKRWCWIKVLWTAVMFIFWTLIFSLNKLSWSGSVQFILNYSYYSWKWYEINLKFIIFINFILCHDNMTSFTIQWFHPVEYLSIHICCHLLVMRNLIINLQHFRIISTFPNWVSWIFNIIRSCDDAGIYEMLRFSIKLSPKFSHLQRWVKKSSKI